MLSAEQIWSHQGKVRNTFWVAVGDGGMGGAQRLK